ncbi:MAG TPA: DUF1173 family protein [Azonexus sp.]|nr:DUF1173 family protein [Azonexus sp.]
MGKTYSVIVELQGQQATKYSPEFQTGSTFAKGWKATLTKAHRGGKVSCTCPGKGGKLLAVRHYDSDSFCLARYPLTGGEHSNDCRFYAPDPEKSGMSGYQKGVIEEGPNGTIKIRLEIGLKKREPTAQDVPPAPAPAAPAVGRNSKPAMRLLGLLNYLWDEADLNSWWPAMKGKRELGRVNLWLDDVASHISAAKVKLNSVLLLADYKSDGPWATNNRQRVGAAQKAKTRLLAIVPLATHSPDREKEMASSLKIAGYHGIPILDMHPGLWGRTCNRFPRAIAAWQQNQRVMAIAELDLKKDGKYANVVDIALMPVTANWIPFDSMFELLIADKLTSEERGFLKPLRFDAEEDVVFPDFILRDTGDDIPLEVFGRTDEAYEARKALKMAYYQKEFGTDRWWYWDATQDPGAETLKPFPEARRKLRDQS